MLFEMSQLAHGMHIQALNFSDGYVPNEGTVARFGDLLTGFSKTNLTSEKREIFGRLEKSVAKLSAAPPAAKAQNIKVILPSAAKWAAVSLPLPV